MRGGDSGTDEPVTIYSRTYVAISILHDAVWTVGWLAMLAIRPVGSFWWWWALIALPLGVVHLIWFSVTLVRIDRHERKTGGDGWPPW